MAEQNSIVCFLWHSGNAREYTSKHVNYFADMVRRNMTIPYRFICVTDDTEGFDDSIELFKLPKEVDWIKGVKTPEIQHLPSSYRRLWLFSKEAKCLGDRILQMDIDALIVKDLAPLFSMPDDFVGWRPMSEHRAKIKPVQRAYRIGGGTWLLRTGTHTHIWENFSVDKIKEVRHIGWRGSDQAWLSYNLAKTCAVFPDSMGIYHSQDGAKQWNTLPENARIVHFNGKVKPWHREAKKRVWYSKFLDDSLPEDKELPQLNCITFLWGDDPYNADYVNKLFNGIDRHLSYPHKNICFTNIPEGIRQGIEIKPLTNEWMYKNLKKMIQYDPENGLKGRVLSFDLDNVIIGPLDKFAENKSEFIICEAVYSKRKGKCAGNFMAFDAGYGRYIWEELTQNYEHYKEVTDGSERFLYDRLIKKMDFWPEGIVSYKQHVLKDKVKNWAKVSIIWHHGKMKPHEVKDKIVVDNWK
jgi:hypothetical protein